MADEVKVLSFWASMFGLRVQFALELKGISYEYLEQDLTNKSQLLLGSNPVHKKIPVLIHNGKPVCESLIILEYIEEAWKNKGPNLLPEDPYERYLARFWADFVDKKVYDAGARIWKTEGEEQKKAIQDLTDVFILLDGALGKVGKGKLFFGGDEIGFVDVTFGSFACWFHAWETICGFKLPGEDQCPRLNRFLHAFSEHPKVKKVLPETEKVLEFAKTIRSRFVKSSLLL